MWIKEMKKIKEKAISQLSTAPEGTLLQTVNHGSVQFYQVISKQRKYLSKKEDEKLLKGLAQKAYALRIVQVADSQIKGIEDLLKSYNEHCIEDVYEQMPEELKKFITPYALPVKEIVKKWQSEEYLTKPDSSKDVTYKTDKGDLVRSKSEVIIANKLFAKKIPYRYECMLELKDGHVVYPDFTIMNPSTGQVIIWEHFGMMDNPEYFNKFVRKYNTYLLNGYGYGGNLICTFESSSIQFDLSSADRYIQLLC